ncbi:MAG: YncE family protein [Actinomycetota bacterium]|nr:YncE family protein [Actinomycetota bacterium]
MRQRRHLPGAAVAFAVTLMLSGCADADGASSVAAGTATAGAQPQALPAAPSGDSTIGVGGSGQPPALPYAHDGRNALQGAAVHAKPLVYVPNQLAGTVQVIDPSSYTVVATYPVARSPEHVVPSHDLSTLWVNSDAGNTLTAIDPGTGRVRGSVPVDDPYNLYFSPDGSEALVMAERLKRIDVRDPTTMALRRSVPVPCRGINHADFSADLTTMLVSCEFTGQLLVLDANATTVQKVIDLNPITTPGATPPSMARKMGGPMAWLEPGASSMPQDVRLAPDGAHFIVADMMRNGVWVIDAHTLEVARFVPTGKGAHGIYPSRDADRVYVSNRDEGSISVFDAATLQPVQKWVLPGGGSPDMGGVTADGSQLWLSGRYNARVYVIDTSTGALLHSIPVNPGPHGLLVWPQPGRFSLGHTGNMR